MRKIAIVGLSLLAAVALGCGSAGVTDDSAGSTDNADKQAAKIGEAARDGKFEFTVAEAKCGQAKVGTDLLGATAQGQFCLVTVKVANIAKEPQSFSDSSQKGFAADGTEYSSDSQASFYTNADASALFSEINPGNSINAVIVFDIPQTASLARLELHDSPFSGGVTVQLA